MNAAIGQANAQATEPDRIVDVFTLVRPEAPGHPVGRVSRWVRQQDNAAIALDWNDFWADGAFSGPSRGLPTLALSKALP